MLPRFIRRQKIRYLLSGIVPIALAVIIIIAFLVNRSSSPIPPSITRKIDYKIAQPSGNYTIKKGSAGYVEQSGVLTYTAAEAPAGPTFQLSEQAIPQAFQDSDQIFPALLNKMHEYDEFQANPGTIDLTHPQELNGSQTAVLKTATTLIFVRPSMNLSESQWRDFFNSLEWN